MTNLINLAESDAAILDAIAELLLHLGKDRAADVIYAALEIDGHANLGGPRSIRQGLRATAAITDPS